MERCSRRISCFTLKDRETERCRMKFLLLFFIVFCYFSASSTFYGRGWRRERERKNEKEGKREGEGQPHPWPSERTSTQDHQSTNWRRSGRFVQQRFNHTRHKLKHSLSPFLDSLSIKTEFECIARALIVLQLWQQTTRSFQSPKSRQVMDVVGSPGGIIVKGRFHSDAARWAGAKTCERRRRRRVVQWVEEGGPFFLRIPSVGYDNF